METEAIALICLGVICLITAIILVACGFGKPVVGAISRTARKAVNAMTKTFTRKRT